MLEPYNDHLSVTIVAVYRMLIEVFGFSYGPFRMVGLLCLVAVPVAYFLTTRRLLGPPLAAIAALAMLGFGSIELRPATLNHYLVLVGGIGCATALNRGRRANWALAAALVLSLSSAGGGVTVAAACLIHNASARPPMRRWLAVLGPCALWGCWWLFAASENGSKFRPTAQPTLSEALGYAGDIAWTPFEHLGLGNPVLTVALAVAFVGYGLWRLRQGLVAAANFLAWSTALGVWVMGLAYSRGPYAIGTTDPGWRTAAAGMLLVVGWTGSMAIRGEVDDSAGRMEQSGRDTKGVVVELDLGPGVIPDHQTLRGFAFFHLRAEEVRSLLDRYGN